MKTFFKHLSIQLFILLSIGVGYAAWNTLVVDGDTLTATKWNDVVNQISTLTSEVSTLSANPPSFSVHKGNVNQSVPSNVNTLITWSTELFDTNNNFDLSTNRFTPTVAGKYLTTLSVHCALSTVEQCYAIVYKNGVQYAVGFSNNDASGSQSAIVTTIVDMNGTSDYIEGWGNNDSGTHIHGNPGYTFFTGIKL